MMGQAHPSYVVEALAYTSSSSYLNNDKIYLFATKKTDSKSAFIWLETKQFIMCPMPLPMLHQIRCLQLIC